MTLTLCLRPHLQTVKRFPSDGVRRSPRYIAVNSALGLGPLLCNCDAMVVASVPGSLESPLPKYTMVTPGCGEGRGRAPGRPGLLRGPLAAFSLKREADRLAPL